MKDMEISKEAKEIALKFIESEEMRECFRNTLLVGNTRLRFDPERNCRDFIVGSRASINEKLAALRKLPPHKDTLDLIRVAEIALAERDYVKDNVFLVTLRYPYFDDKRLDNTYDDRVPFLSFESVMNWIKKQTDRECELNEETLEQCMNRVWYEVEKFVPDENSELELKITWALNAKGEIMFFEIDDRFDEKYKIRDISGENEDNDWRAWFDWEGSDNWEYPPIPFDFGDIITIDMRPFYEDIRGVIVRIDDNCNCCAVACIYCDEDGYLYCRTLKHDLHMVLTKVSPLYRAEVFKGELPENERALRIISEAIKKIPSTEKISEVGTVYRRHELADQIDDFLYSDDYKKKNGYFGCSWDEFSKRFGM